MSGRRSRAYAYLTGTEGISLADAIDRQLGLKLEERKVSMPVVIIDQVNQRPTDNPPDLEVRLPRLPRAEFEVADIKPSNPDVFPPFPPGGIGFLPGGRVNLPRFPLRYAILLAWNLSSAEELVGAPKWLDSLISFDIMAIAPAAFSPTKGTAPLEELA